MDRFEEVKLRIKDSVDLVAQVESYVQLKPRGRYRIGLCPFHQEKTPSFTVFPDTQHFKCFGCGKAGDVFTFVMEREGLSFREAMEALAERVGISLDGVFGSGRKDHNRGVDVAGTLATVRDFLAAALHSSLGGAAREYLAQRGLAEGVEPFGLGFHPTGGKLTAFARKHKLSPEVLVQAGLLSQDRRHERFAGRLMFPIEDERGRVVGFGGRVLDTDQERAKYINSSESPFFNKRRLLFGLRQAKQAGVRQLVVMEGYTDVLAAHLAGQQGAVATLGTALTADHARLLERYATEGVVLLFDGDRAGRQACDRAFRELVHTRLPVRIALLPEGQDPADLAREGGNGLAELVASAQDQLQVWFRLLRQRLDLSLDVNVERAALECARIIQGVESPVRRDALVQAMASHLGVQAASLGQQVRQLLRRGVTSGAGRPSDEPEAQEAAPRAPRRGPPSAIEQAEMDLLACLLADPTLHSQLHGLVFHSKGIAELVEMVAAGLAADKTSTPQIVGYLFMRCADREDDLSELLARCSDRVSPIKNPPSHFLQLHNDLCGHAARNEARRLRQQAFEAETSGNTSLAKELTRSYVERLRAAKGEPRTR